MPECGVVEFARYGVITETQIMNSQIQNSTITGSELASSKIVSLAEIDPASAQVVADAIAQLPVDQRKALAQALFEALAPGEAGTQPATEEAAQLPTALTGKRSMLMGEPDKWGVMPDGNVFPTYKPGA